MDKWMTLRHLSVFLVVCEENSMTGAAKRLHMTQPSVSQTIRELEDDYEVCLFERLGRRLYITPAGQSLLSYARQILSLTSQAEQALHSFSRTAPVRIGASVTIGEVFLVELLRHLKKGSPAQETLSEIRNTSELEHIRRRYFVALFAFFTLHGRRAGHRRAPRLPPGPARVPVGTGAAQPDHVPARGRKRHAGSLSPHHSTASHRRAHCRLVQ